MDSNRPIIALIVVLTCLILIILLKSVESFRKRKFVRLLAKAAQKHQTTIILHEQWNNSAIGINKNGTQLFIVNNDGTCATVEVLMLLSFKKCSLINDNSGAEYKEGDFKVTNAIELELISENNPPKRISFYNIEKDGSLLTQELELAEKWCSIINNCITQRAWLSSWQRK